ncbi:MAG: hypothetical protein LBH58_04705, partial [Tannerellaceae bacterium]|nr:hypothetical protein [Tannerellaceae bacterium]
KTDIDQPAVILIVRDKRFVGSNATVTVELNGVRIGTMRNNSFLLCKTTMANNTITLKEFKKDIHIQAKSGEKTLLHYHYSGINAVHTEIESGVEYQKLQEAIKGIKGLGVGRLLLDLLVGGFFIWGGASEVLVLRFTNKYSGVVVILGVIIALGGIVSFVRRLRKENAAVMLDRFLKEAGHPESSNERKY